MLRARAGCRARSPAAWSQALGVEACAGRPRRIAHSARSARRPRTAAPGGMRGRRPLTRDAAEEADMTDHPPALNGARAAGPIAAACGLALVSWPRWLRSRLSGVADPRARRGGRGHAALRFEDRADGSIAVIRRAHGGRRRHRARPGRLRARHACAASPASGGARASAPSRRSSSSARADGRLTLIDPAPAGASTSNPSARPTQASSPACYRAPPREHAAAPQPRS